MPTLHALVSSDHRIENSVTVRSNGASPLPEAGLAQPAPPLDLFAVRFRRQDGMFSPKGGVYKLSPKEAAKFVKQGSAVYEDKRRKTKGKEPNG